MIARLPPHHRILTLICVGITAVACFLYATGWFYGLAERHLRDWLLTNSAARRSPQNPRIAFLAIDESTLSLDTLFAEDLEKSPALRLMKQGFPWNREVYAQIIKRLADAGATAILFDLVFPSPRDGDEAFRAALERYSDKVVIGTRLESKDEERADGSLVSHMPRYIPPAATLQPAAGRASWLGFVSIHTDEDGLVRRAFFRTTLLEFFGKPAPPGMEELYSLDARGLEKMGLSRRIPETRHPVMFRFAEEFVPHSLYEIFVDNQWNAPPYNGGKFFRDKIIVIGASGQSSEDRMQTPYGTMLGSQIHLSALNAALNGDFVRETSEAGDFALIVGSGALAWVLGAWIRRPVLRLLILAGTILAFYEASQHLANEWNILPPLLSPLLTMGASVVTWSAWEQVLDRAERQRIRRMLERYVSKDIVHEVLDNPRSYLSAMGGVRKEITILFSDVRGFTSRAESADPHALVKQLNEYFEAMVAIVFANHGTLDKFIGDAVMAHWGSIVSEGPAADARRAVDTVLQMRRALLRLNTGWRVRGVAEMRVGFGINHGEAIVGNLGCEAKMEVAVIGDAVNLASRLEGVTKSYGVDLCLGESAAALVRDGFILRSIDLLVVVGRTKPAEILTVIDERGTPEPPWLQSHEEAVRLYRAGEFAGAERLWRVVLDQAPGDSLAEIFIERCAQLQEHPPSPPWTGVYQMKSK